MSSAETKRPKRHRSANIDTTEDLLDEWLTPKNNPVMQGLVSFLNVRPTEAAPATSGITLSPGDNVYVNNINNTALREFVAGDKETVSPGDNERVSSGDIERLSPGDEESVSSGDDKPQPHTSGVNYPLADKRAVSKITVGGDTETLSPKCSSVVPLSDGIAVREQQLQVRSLTRAEDGHSANEQRTYLALWNSANPVIGQPFRRNTIGHAGLAKMLKVDKRQTKRWIPQLIEKLTIEIEIESSYATKTTYRVFDRDEIHARRVRSGYTSFIKNRGGVELLKANSIGGDSYSVPPGDTVPPGGGDTVSPPYKEANSKRVFKEDSSSEVRTVMEHLHLIGIYADDDFAHQLVRRSRAVCHDATITEILHFTEAKARYRGIQKSLTGFLLTAVPMCLTGESFRLYRQAELARAVAERESWIRMRSESERTLTAPQSREAWEIDNAESTLKWLREQQPWVFNTLHSSDD